MQLDLFSLRKSSAPLVIPPRTTYIHEYECLVITPRTADIHEYVAKTFVLRNIPPIALQLNNSADSNGISSIPNHCKNKLSCWPRVHPPLECRMQGGVIYLHFRGVLRVGELGDHQEAEGFVVRNCVVPQSDHVLPPLLELLLQQNRLKGRIQFL